MPLIPEPNEVTEMFATLRPSTHLATQDGGGWGEERRTG